MQIVKFTTTLAIAAFHSEVSFVPGKQAPLASVVRLWNNAQIHPFILLGSALIGRTSIALSSSMLIPAYATLAVTFANMYFAGKAVTSGSVDTKPGKLFPSLYPLLPLPDSDQNFAVIKTKRVP